MFPSLVDMRKSAGKMEHEMESKMEAPSMYPYGLCLHLEKEQIDALNLMEMPEPGEEFKILAMGVVTNAAMEADGRDPRIGIQITSLQLIPNEDEMGEENTDTSRKPNTVIGNSYRSY